MTYKVNCPDDQYWQDQINCQSACPVKTDARGYIRAIAREDYQAAYLIARGPNPLASICGRICAAPCEVNCRRGEIDRPVSIRALKRFASEKYFGSHNNDQVLELLKNIKNYVKDRENLNRDEITALPDRFTNGDTKIAVVGSGPAGLACSHDLALLGFAVTVFESEKVAGGMLAVGIPDYRLPREIIAGEVKIIEALGVEFKTGITIGEDIQFNQLARDFKAVVIAVGAKRSRMIPIPGADHPGVLGGVEFLRDASLGHDVKLGNKVVVIGGGSVAYDVGRSALRHEPLDVSRQAYRAGVEQVYLCCLESLKEMPADLEEIIEGEKEGITRLNSLGPKEIVIKDGKIVAIRLKKVLSVFDSEGRFAPSFDEDDITEIECDNVMIAIGQQVDFSFIDSTRDGITMNQRGLVDVEPDGSTAVPWLYIAGDCAYGTRLVIDAVAHGKKVARTIAGKLAGVEFPALLKIDHQVIENYARESSYEEIERQHIPTLEVVKRFENEQSSVEIGFGDDAARIEAGRCLDCGVNTIFNGEVCILCGGCVDVCPEFCLKLVSLADIAIENGFDPASSGFGPDDSGIIKDETACIRCACCADRCPVGAITMERVTFCELGA